MFKNFKIYQKYLLAGIIIAVISLYYFSPFFTQPNYLYKTEDIFLYKEIAKAKEKFIEDNKRQPQPIELVDKLNLQLKENGLPIGDLNNEVELRKIERLLLYTEGNSWIVLLFQPLHYNLIYINVFILVFIFLYLGYQYTKDPPQGAYIDKIMYMFLFVVSLDILHQWAFIKNVELYQYMSLFEIGQYFSLLVYFGLVIFFYIRLKFINSVVGEFYETEIQINPKGITRWIDGIDKFILNNFSSSKDIKNRLFEQRTN